MTAIIYGFLLLLSISKMYIAESNNTWTENIAGGTASLIFDKDQVIIWDNLLKEEMWRIGDGYRENRYCENTIHDATKKMHYKFDFVKLKRTATNLTKVYTQEYKNDFLHIKFYRDFIFHDDHNTTAVILQETYQRQNYTRKPKKAYDFTSLCVSFYKRQYRQIYTDNGTMIHNKNATVRHLLLYRNRFGKKLDFPVSLVESAGGATCFTNITAFRKYPTLFSNISKLTGHRFRAYEIRGHYTLAKRNGDFPSQCDILTSSYILSINQMQPPYCPVFLSKVGNHSIQSLSHRFGGKYGLYEDFIDFEGHGKEQNVPVVFSYSLFGIATSAGKDAVYANTTDFFSFLKQRGRAQVALLDYARTLHDLKVPYSWGSKECGAGLPLKHWEVFNLCQIGRYTVVMAVQSGNQIFPKDLLKYIVKLLISHRRPLRQLPWFPHSFDENDSWLCPEFVLNTHLDSLHLLLMYSLLDHSFVMSRSYGSPNATEDFPRLQEILDSAMDSLLQNIDCFLLRTEEGILFAYSCPEDGEAENAEIDPWMYGYHYYSTFLLAHVIEFAEIKGLKFNRIKLRKVLKEACKRTLAYARSPEPKKYFGKNSDIIYICAFIVDDKRRTQNYHDLLKVGGVPVIEAVALGRHIIDFGPPDTLYLHKIPSVPIILFDISPNATFLSTKQVLKTNGLSKILHANPDFPYITPDNLLRSRSKRIFFLSNIGYDGLDISGKGELEVKAFVKNQNYHSVYTKYYATEDPPFVIYSSEVPLYVRKVTKRLSGLRVQLKTTCKVKVSIRYSSSGDDITLTKSRVFLLGDVSLALEISGHHLTIDGFSSTQSFLYIAILTESTPPKNSSNAVYPATIREYVKEDLLFKSRVIVKQGRDAFLAFNQTILTRYDNVSWVGPKGRLARPIDFNLSSPDIIEEFYGMFIKSVTQDDYGVYFYNYTSSGVDGKCRKEGGKVELIEKK